MMGVLNFIFSDIWHFLGTCILLGIISSIFNGFITINNNSNKDDKNKE